MWVGCHVSTAGGLANAVERAYEGSGPAYECTNPRFFDCTDEGPEGLRAFDLRDALPQQ